MLTHDPKMKILLGAAQGNLISKFAFACLVYDVGFDGFRLQKGGVSVHDGAWRALTLTCIPHA